MGEGKPRAASSFKVPLRRGLCRFKGSSAHKGRSISGGPFLMGKCFGSIGRQGVGFPYPFLGRLVGRLEGDSRRRFLAGAAAVPVLAAAPAVALTDMTQADLILHMVGVLEDARAQPNPDAELLAAFEEWRVACIAAENAPLDLPLEDRERLWQRVSDALEKLETIPATTPAGVAVKLRYLLAATDAGTDAYDAIYYGRPPTEDTLIDHRSNMLWDLIGEVERLSV